MTEVRPGQVWADNDKRSAGRTLRVDAIDGDKAACTILTNTVRAQREIDAHGTVWVRDMRGKPTKISLRRFKPTNTGYRLVSGPDAEEATPNG